MATSASPSSVSYSGVALILLSAAAFGAMAIFARFALDDGVDTITLLLFRFAIASVAMIALQVLRRERWPNGRTLVELSLLGGVGYVAQSLCYFTALNFASAGLVALLLYVFPALVAILAAMFLGERLTASGIMALLLAMCGSALTIELSAGGDVRGILLAFAAALIYAIYIVAGRDVTARAGSTASSTVIITSAAVVYAAIAIARGVRLPATGVGWWAIMAIALVSTVLALVTFFAGLSRVGATRAAMLSTFEPVVTLLLAAVVLGERVTPRQLTGGALILVAVLLLTASGAKATGGGFSSSSSS